MCKEELEQFRLIKQYIVRGTKQLADKTIKLRQLMKDICLKHNIKL